MSTLQSLVRIELPQAWEQSAHVLQRVHRAAAGFVCAFFISVVR